MKIIWCMVPEIWSTTGNVLSFWTIFCPFTPLTTQKIKILKIWKNCPEISFYTSVPKIMLYFTVPEIWHVTDVIFTFHFGPFFALLLPKVTACKVKILKKIKTLPEDIVILHICTKNYDHIMYSWWDTICNWWTEWQMNEQMEKVTYKGGSPM